MPSADSEQSRWFAENVRPNEAMLRAVQAQREIMFPAEPVAGVKTNPG